jgi:hypothetical protein
MVSSARLQLVVGGHPSLGRRGDHPQPQRLREEQRVAGLRTGVRRHPRGIHRAEHDHAELGLGVGDGVAPEDRDAGVRGGIDAALQHARQHAQGQVVDGPRDDVQGQEGRAAHRVDIRHRVRGCDAAPVVRVVDDRGEEVEGGDDRPVLVQRPDRGVVARIDTHQDLGRHAGQLQRPHDLQQLVGPELAPHPAP